MLRRTSIRILNTSGVENKTYGYGYGFLYADLFIASLDDQVVAGDSRDNDSCQRNDVDLMLRAENVAERC